jgi:hypothetical protein
MIFNLIQVTAVISFSKLEPHPFVFIDRKHDSTHSAASESGQPSHSSAVIKRESADDHEHEEEKEKEGAKGKESKAKSGRDQAQICT